MRVKNLKDSICNSVCEFQPAVALMMKIVVMITGHFLFRGRDTYNLKSDVVQLAWISSRNVITFNIRKN